MSEIFSDYFAEIFLVSIGAMPGAFLRFKILETNINDLSFKSWKTFQVNVLACFLFGWTLSFYFEDENDIYNNLFFLLAIGFLGSLSTFSTFIYELFTLLMNKRWKDSFSISFCSIFVGLAVLFTGYYLGGL